MEYIMEEIDDSIFAIEKHMESNGFFRNVSGSSKIGEIRLGDFTIGGNFSDLFDVCGNYDVYYMELGCISGFSLNSYRGEAPQVSIGDKEHNIPVEERIKFLYEALSSNMKYECLGIIYKDSNNFVGHNSTLFRIEFAGNDNGIAAFNISD